MLRKVCRLVALLVFLVHPGLADFLTGSNDIIAVVREETGELTASPFSVQFGKKDLWLCRNGHRVTLIVNSAPVHVEMILDSDGSAYFPSNRSSHSSEPDRTTTATSGQLGDLDLRPGVNNITFSVETFSNCVATDAKIYLIKEPRIVVSDIDGTITK